MKTTLTILYALVVVIVPNLAGASAVHEYELDNGLKLLVKPDHRAPVVVSQIWYKVGSSYEPPGITGISHMLEHMMFKGTTRHGPGEFSRIVAAEGGRENAFTSYDYTAYFQSLEKSRLRVSFELEADRMANLVLQEQGLEPERRVVMEERRLRTEDKPQSLTVEYFNATAFATSPYRHPVIGWMDDIAHYRLEALKAWHRQWYVPNNATVVVVGDVEPEAVRAMAQEYFGPLPRGPVGRPTASHEIPQPGPRRITVRLPAQVPFLIMGFKAPSLSTAPEPWEAYALEVLATLLDGNDSARLPRDLVRGRSIAASAGAGYDLYDRLGTLFQLSGTPAQASDVDALEKAFWEHIESLREQPVTARELRRVATQAVAQKVFAQDSVFYQAMQIGILETVGLGWQRLDEYVDGVRAVTAEQVQAVARKYLVRDRMTLAVLEPRQASVQHGAQNNAN